ncbi:MAG TPA: hypothetical protein VG204_12880 [Terriglobia bacterium]|nr:hypothetical protein [Terriglobia bacterium]
MSDTWLVVFVLLAAIAILLQALVMVGIYFALQNLHRDILGIQVDTKQKLESLSQMSQRVIEFVADSREPVRTLTTNLAEISRTLRERTAQWDGVAEDLADRTRLQIIRLDQMVTALVERAESTAGVVEKSILTPVQEVTAVLAGIRKGLDFLFTRRRATSVSDVAQDEQMFI